MYIAYIRHKAYKPRKYRKVIKGIINICPQILVAKSGISNTKFLSAYEINNWNNKQKQIFLNKLKVFYLWWIEYTIFVCNTSVLLVYFLSLNIFFILGLDMSSASYMKNYFTLKRFINQYYTKEFRNPIDNKRWDISVLLRISKTSRRSYLLFIYIKY